MIRKVIDHLKRNGIRQTYYTGLGHLENAYRDLKYLHTLAGERTGSQELKAQRMSKDKDLKISVLVPLYEPDPDHFREMTESVKAQTYDNFELILADGSPAEELQAIKVSKEDERIRYVRSASGGGISENTNAALKAAVGEVVTMLDQDDLIEPDALYRIAESFKQGYEAVYTDEDKYVTESGIYISPYRKRDFNQDLLLSNNYICHLFAVKKELAVRAGGFNGKYDGAQDHDFILRCCALAGDEKIHHIPRVLYHWRIHEGSTAGNPMAKVYAYESGKRAVKNFLKERKINAEVLDTAHRGFFRVIYTDTVPKDKYRLFVDGRLKALTRDYEEILSSYFAREDVGIVGGRVIGANRRIVCSGYEKDKKGRIRSLFYGMDHRLPGNMNTAELVMDVEAVSRYACVVRSELLGCMAGNSYRICEKIRKKGYRVLIDPKVVFEIKR